MLQASCHCGGVRFEVDALLPVGHHCYCTICRRISGNPSSAILRAERTGFRITHGKDLLSEYHATDYFTRYHCKVCHSHIYGDMPELPVVFLRPGLFDPSAIAGIRWEHMNVADKVPWHEILDGEKQHAGLPDN